MKKLLFVLVVLTAGLGFGFAGMNGAPEDFLTRKLDRDHLFSVENAELEAQLEHYFVSMFDDVVSIDAQYDAGRETYYYSVRGSLNGAAAHQLLKVQEQDIHNQTYTYIEFERLNVDLRMMQCCVDVIAPDSCPVGECIPGDGSCLGFVCGVVVSGGRCAIF